MHHLKPYNFCLKHFLTGPLFSEIIDRFQTFKPPCILWIYEESALLLKYHGKQERTTGNHRFNIEIIRELYRQDIYMMSHHHIILPIQYRNLYQHCCNVTTLLTAV